MKQEPAFTWKFQRMGGLDQVTLHSAAEICHLDELDPKLWAALSCPASGLEFDQRTLALIDTDNDGRIRIPEVVQAVNWLCERLGDSAVIVEPEPALSLSLIENDTETGRRLKETGRMILQNLGKPQAEAVGQEDVAEAVAKASENLFNGDGILPSNEEFGVDVAGFIRDVLSVTGGVVDAGGQPGVNKEIAAAFMQTVKDLDAWHRTVGAAQSPLGKDTAEAWELLQRLKTKVDDYFLRCELAAFAPQRTDALNGIAEPEEPSAQAAHGLLDLERLAELPLSRIEADRPLHLDSGLNPAWRGDVQRFFALARPLLDTERELDKAAWGRVQDGFAPYSEALAQKPKPTAVKVDVAPTQTADSLSEERIEELLQGDAARRFTELADKDATAPAAFSDIADMERLVLYYLHLHRLLMNFVSFYDFYSLRRGAAFQYGTLYLDGRACRLCLPVKEQASHASLAAYSQLCLIYCDCRKKEGGGNETMSIVAAMTAGDADLLVEGRNGVFVDNAGADWDAKLVKIVSNPISIWQSLWEPYQRFGRMVSEQISKFAGARQASIESAAAERAANTGAALTAGTAPASASAPAASGQNFDIGKSVGIFAAIGLAIGAIGTAVAGLASALFALSWWQFPLIILGLFLIISGPSCIMAWLKLRKRNLGPLLEASGWAVNSRIPINLTLGAALTSTAMLPPNATRSYRDPLGRPSRWPLVLATAALVALIAGAWLWFKKDEIHWPDFLKKPAVTQPAAGTAASPVPKAAGSATNGTKQAAP